MMRSGNFFGRFSGKATLGTMKDCFRETEIPQDAITPHAIVRVAGLQSQVTCRGRLACGRSPRPRRVQFQVVHCASFAERIRPDSFRPASWRVLSEITTIVWRRLIPAVTKKPRLRGA
jgi:hypothetical protein